MDDSKKIIYKTIKEKTIIESKGIDEVSDDKLLDEWQKYLYSQSSNFSKLSRAVVYGLIGIIWILFYGKDGFNSTNNTLLLALCLGFLYLSIDIVHYFWDTCFYRQETKFLCDNNISDNVIAIHKKNMAKNAKRSFCWIIAKFIFLLSIVLTFFIGFIQQFDIINNLF